jgi:hypothetical protein
MDEVFVWEATYSSQLTHHAASVKPYGQFRTRYVHGDLFEAMKERAEKAESALRDK